MSGQAPPSRVEHVGSAGRRDKIDLVTRNGWGLLIGFIVLVLAWWGLRMLWWRMNYLVPAFGLGLIAGVALTLWLVRPRR